VTSAYLAQEYTTDFELISGRYYQFRIESRNIVGYSLPSEPLTLHASQVPDKPEVPTTVIEGDSIRFSWQAPHDGHSAITGYTLKIKQHDGVFIEEPVNCDASQSVVVEQLTCLVPIARVIVEPYLLPWGTNVGAIVSASNSKGMSLFSDEGNGGVILTNPESPTALANVPALTNKSQIGLTWESVEVSGGSAILDYQVLYAPDGAEYQVLASGIQPKSYTATGLTTGLNYHFKVQSRTEYGLSMPSAEVTILAAEMPEQPFRPVTSIASQSVVIEWQAPYDNGSPITSYLVEIIK
jgi:hypothetical protein